MPQCKALEHYSGLRPQNSAGLSAFPARTQFVCNSATKRFQIDARAPDKLIVCRPMSNSWLPKDLFRAGRNQNQF